jgi:membrane dipeptidase
MPSKYKLSRREMMAMVAQSAVGASVIGSAAWAREVDEYGGFSGNKNFKYISAPATVYDFGLTPEQEEHAKELHESLIIFDALSECTFYPEFIINMKRGGGTSGNFSIGISDMLRWTPDTRFEPEEWWSWEALNKDLDALYRIMHQFQDDAMLTLNHADILEAKKAGKVGFMPGTQNTKFLDDTVDRLDRMHRKGLRIIQITYNATNAVGAGSMEAPENRFGLSRLGHMVVERMNEIGMLIDTGHSSPETQFRAAEVSTKPIIISHAGMMSKIEQPRATTDEAIKLVADKGGVMGVISTPSAIAGSDKCTVEDMIDNIEHAVNIAGIDGVGFGSDFIIPATIEQILSAPEWDEEVVAGIGAFEVWPWSDGHVGWENNSAYPNMTRGLIKRGYSDEDIAKIMGGNFLRVIKDTIG